MNKKLKNTGITLISLVITIIIMLILVGVSITLAVNGGLFEYAGNAVGDTKNAIAEENEIGNGGIEVDGEKYGSINEYLYGKPIEGHDGEMFSPIYKETTKITQTEGDKTYTAWIPKGFAVGTSEKISKISTGLVIRDAEGNEFVWIPVEGKVEEKKLVNPYPYSSSYSEPNVLTGKYSSSDAVYDSQKTLDYLYGENYYNYAKDFNYASEYTTMVDRVNYYDGFYIGRYETTIDESGNIGSKYDTEVLTAGTTLFTKNGENYPYRWYGLYYAQKKANVTGNEENGWVQTAMIYGQLWDKTMEFIRTNDTNYNVASYTSGWHSGSGVVKSGQANKTTVGANGAIGDVALNIWDLESNAWEWTQEVLSTNYRVFRGGVYNYSNYASIRYYSLPGYDGTNFSSRLALYITNND